MSVTGAADGGTLLVAGLAQLWHYRRAASLGTAPYVFSLVDSLLLAAALLAPNPFATVPVPVAMPLRFASSFRGLASRGPQELRGRDAAVDVWTA